MKSLQQFVIVWMVNNLERFPIDLLTEAVPLRLKIRLLCHLPVVDICKLEKTPFVSGVDMEAIWSKCCESFREININHNRSRFQSSSLTSKDKYFYRICSTVVNVNLQKDGYRSTEFRNLCMHWILSCFDRFAARGPVQSSCDSDMFIPARYRRFTVTNVSMMDLVVNECGYQTKTIVFSNDCLGDYILSSNEVLFMKFISEVHQLIFNPLHGHKACHFAMFCGEVLKKFFANSSTSLYYIEFVNCDLTVWHHLSNLLLPMSQTYASEPVINVSLKGLAVMHDEEVDYQAVDSVAGIIGSILSSQTKLEAFFIDNWQFSTTLKSSSKLLTAITQFSLQPAVIKSIGLFNTNLTTCFLQTLICNFFSTSFQELQLDCITVPKNLNIELRNPFTHSCTESHKSKLHLSNLDFRVLSPWCSCGVTLNLESLAFTFPKDGSDSVIGDLLTHSHIYSSSINLSGVKLYTFCDTAKCFEAILHNRVLSELYLDHCSLTSGNLLSKLAKHLPKACSLHKFSLRSNNLGHLSEYELSSLFSCIWKIPSLHDLELDISANFLTLPLMVIVKNTVVDTGNGGKLKRLTAQEIVAITGSGDETLHDVLTAILEEVSNKHVYSVVSNNWVAIDHIANM